MNKEAAQEVARFRRLGWQAEERGGHIHLTHPDHDKVVMASTASDHRAVQNNRANVAAAMGISKSELEVRMGQRQRKRKGGRSRKRKGPGQQSSLIARSLPAHRAPVAPPPPPPGSAAATSGPWCHPAATCDRGAGRGCPLCHDPRQGVGCSLPLVR